MNEKTLGPILDILDGINNTLLFCLHSIELSSDIRFQGLLNCCYNTASDIASLRTSENE